mmetsp:Transcript_11226/g.34585  ORF Transcript_11226/g.34585 Transcript_11226/m.34585 type:complete len:227 (+) Transcript_11226:989-1669(+)
MISASSAASMASCSTCNASSSCGARSLRTLISRHLSGRSFASRCAVKEAVREAKSVVAFTLARTTTFIACCPNSSELTVSNLSLIVGATQTTRQVLAAPPNAGESSRVSFDSRKGGRSRLLSEARASMHRPSVVSDWLIDLASSKLCPCTPERFILSEPAKSTRYRTPSKLCTPPVRRIRSMRTECERDDSSFKLVRAVWRLRCPATRTRKAWANELTSSHSAPLT